MVYAFTQDVPIDAEFYGRIADALGSEPMDGLLLHLAVAIPTAASATSTSGRARSSAPGRSTSGSTRRSTRPSAAAGRPSSPR